jgi:DNA polymerase-1
MQQSQLVDQTLIKKKLYLIDGSGFIFRAFHAIPPLTREDGTQVNAVYGFCTMLSKLLNEYHAEHVAVIFDAARKNFRNEIYPDYKAHRPPTPPELIPQFDLIREATEAYHIPWFAEEGYEADDLIATFAEFGKKNQFEVIIVSSDKDLMQLVTQDVTLFDHFKNVFITPNQVIEKYGVPPEKMIEIQSLMGDSSDNVPGVPKIGPKTAAELILQFGSLEHLLENLDKIPQKGRRENLIEHQEMARLSHKLVTLKKDVPIEVTIENFERKPFDFQKLIDFMKAQNFKTLVARYEKMNATMDAPILRQNYTCVTDIETLDKWIHKIRETGLVAVDTETTSLNPHLAQIVGVSLGLEKGEACYIPLSHVGPFGQLEKNQIPRDLALQKLKPLLEDPGILKIGHNIKYDTHIFAHYGIDIAPFDDTMLLSYVLENGLHGHSLDELASLFFDHDMIKFKDVVGSGKAQLIFNQVPIDQATIYAAEDADFTFRLHQILKPRLMAEHMMRLYEEMDRPLVSVLKTMEQRGILLDINALLEAGQHFSIQARELEKKIFELSGEEFNIGSPKQLGEILFEKLKLPAPKKGKAGNYETNSDILEPLAQSGHVIAELVLAWRQYSKLMSTYVEGLKAEINPKTKRIHTSYGMTMTSTGRLNSSNPNLQNIPTRTEEGRRIRKAFKAAPGYKLVSLDYSQIELRLLAELAKIDELQKAFHEKADIHKLTASQIFGMKLEDVTSDIRRKAKAINFGIIYGISAFGLAKQLNCPQKEADIYIKAYFERYPGIQNYMEETKEFCRQNGFVKTIMGRKCFIPDIHNKNPAIRNFSERAAINAPLQGSNADIIKMAMIKIHRLLKTEYPQTSLLLQVHDELIFEMPEADLPILNPIIKNIMENIAPLSVPLLVDIGSGDNWAEAGEKNS